MTFVTARERSYLAVVERTTKKKMERMNAPTLDQALEGQQRAVLDKIIQTIESNNLQFYRQAAEELLSNHDPATVVASVLKMLTKEPDTTPVRLTEEKPLPSRRDRDKKPQDRRRSQDYNRNKSYKPRTTGKRTGAKPSRTPR